jgi:hypothetical protein
LSVRTVLLFYYSTYQLAERVGFEPTNLLGYELSRPAH